MKYYDVTMVIKPTMVVYKDYEHKKPVFSVASSKATGGSTNETNVHFNVHTGTHIDFYHHVSDTGKTSRDFPLTTLMRPAKVFDLTNLEERITAHDLKTLDIEADDVVLFKTRNSFENFFNTKFIFVDESAANYLVRKKVFAVGLDALGIERDQAGHPTHHALLRRDIIIIEGLRLAEVPGGHYNMIALPLKLDDVDGLPLSVVLTPRS